MREKSTGCFEMIPALEKKRSLKILIKHFCIQDIIMILNDLGKGNRQMMMNCFNKMVSVMFVGSLFSLRSNCETSKL